MSMSKTPKSLSASKYSSYLVTLHFRYFLKRFRGGTASISCYNMPLTREHFHVEENALLQ